MSKESVLNLLQEAAGGWVSGGEISRSLGVSRTAVWKQIERLRAEGYELEAVSRKGYRLIATPDSVTPLQVLPGLTTRRLGRQIEYRESVGSTNDLAKQLARAGAPEGLLVIADEQTAGRGRLGRTWSTPRGSALAMSLVLRPTLPPYVVPRVTLVAAVAVAKAVQDVTGLPVGIKWPNDLQLRGRKFCGILTEMEAESDRVAFLVCGIGLNVNLPAEQIDPAYQESATSLLTELGRRVERAQLIQSAMARFEESYDLLLSDRFDQVLDQWRALSITLGQTVRVLFGTGTAPLDGVAEAVDDDGALLVRLQGGELKRVLAGDVSIRPTKE